MKNIKIVVPLCFFLISTCFGLDDATSTKSEQQLKVQKREKQYLIEDDSNEGHEQKRDERQSTPVKNNHHNLDANGNSRIINIRLQPQPNIVTVPKQVIKPEVSPKRDTTPQRIPTKIPVVLKTVKVVPGPAHALRMKILQNKINETINANKEKALCENNGTPTNPNKDIPCFTIEDKNARRADTASSPNNIDDVILNRENNATPRTDDKETSNNTGNNKKNDDDDQVTSNLDKGTFHKNNENPDISENVRKPVHFYVDEPEPLPPSFRRQQHYENTAFQNKEVTPTKSNRIPISIKGKFDKKDESRKADCENYDENDPDIVKISNGTHIISIKKIQNPETHKAERIGEEITVPTEERIVNQSPLKPKSVVDEPEKHSFGIEKLNIGRDKNIVLPGLVFKDYKMKEDKDKNNCNTITNHNYEEIDNEKPLISPVITFQPAYPPTYNAGVQDSWNYLQNPYCYPYYQNIYDQYRRNCELAQVTPNIYGQDNTDPRNYGTQINPGQQNIDLSGPPITLPYYPNGIPATDTDLTQYPYSPNTYETQSKIAGPQCQVDAGNRVPADGLWRSLKDVEICNRFDKTSQKNDIDDPDIDIRRSVDGKTEAYTVDVIGKVANPYATTSLPISVNGALVYPYRYIRR